MSLLIEREIFSWNPGCDFGRAAGDEQWAPKEDGEDVYVEDFVYTDQWEGDESNSDVLLGTFNSKVSCRGNKCNIDAGPLRRVNYSLVSNLEEDVLCVTQAEFPVPIRKPDIFSVKKTETKEASVASEIIKNPSASTFYSYRRPKEQVGSRKTRLETALVIVFKNGALQLSFSSGKTTEVPMKCPVKKIWSLDVGILIEVSTPPSHYDIRYYTIVHPLNGLQPFILENACDSSTLLENINKEVCSDSRNIKTSACNAGASDWKIVKLADKRTKFGNSVSNRIILALDKVQKKYKIFSYFYTWEERERYGKICSSWIRNSCEQKSASSHFTMHSPNVKNTEDRNYFAEVPGASCLPISLSCSTKNFPEDLTMDPKSIFITSDNGFCPLIWFLTKKVNSAYEVSSYGFKKVYKRVSTEGSTRPSPVKVLMGFKLDTTDVDPTNNICRHEWKSVLNMNVLDAVKIKCTSFGRFDLLLILSAYNAALWTGYNDLIPCVVPCIANFSPSIAQENLGTNKYEPSETHTQRFSKKIRVRNSDVFPGNSLSVFKIQKASNNSDANQSNIHLRSVNDYKARIFMGSDSSLYVDICMDMRIKCPLVNACFEVMNMPNTSNSNILAKEFNRRYLFMRFGGHNDTLTEWEDYLAAFVCIMHDCGYSLLLDSEPLNVSDSEEIRTISRTSSIVQCFLNNNYGGNDVDTVFLGSKCPSGLTRLDTIRKKGVSASSNKFLMLKTWIKPKVFLKSLNELSSYFHHLYQAFRIRTFDKSNYMLLSEFTTIMSYIINRPDLVSYYATTSSIVFPLRVFSQDLSLNQENLLSKGHDIVDIFNWACNLLRTEGCSEVRATAETFHPYSAWFKMAPHSEKQPSCENLNTFVPDRIKHLHTLCSLLNMESLLAESPSTADTLFHLLKNDLIAEKFGPLHPGLMHFVICIKEQLKLVNPEPSDHSLYSVIGRDDLALNKIVLHNRASVIDLLHELNIENNDEHLEKVIPSTHLSSNRDDGIYPLIKNRIIQAIFPKDKRIHEVRKLLQSSYPAYLTRMDISDIKFAMESNSDGFADQDHLSTLLYLAQRTLALPIGRAAFTLGTVVPISVKKIPIPALVVSANLPPTNSVTVLESSKTDKGFLYWPKFHNGVAAGLSISPDWKTLDSSWIVYNRDANQQVETECLESQHAGFLFGLGLTGRLSMMNIVDLVEYMNNNEGFIAVGLIIGLAASYISTKDEKLTRLCNLHIEPNIPKQFDASCENLIKPSAVISLGLLHMGRPDRSHIITVLNLFNSSIKFDETDITEAQMNSLILSCGLALGYMLLGKLGSNEARCVASLGITDTLLEYTLNPSMNSITSISSLLALGLMYLKTNNEVIASRVNLLVGNPICANSHKDVILYAIVCKNLIMWNDVKPTKEWVESNVPPKYRRFLFEITSNQSSESISICRDDTILYIIAGACFSIGITHAGTSDPEAKDTLLYYLKILVRLHYLKAMNLSERLRKAAAKACLNVLLNAASLVSAGSGDIDLMRIMRKLHFRRFQEIGYGDQLALHLSLGFLFLGGGTCTFRTTDRAVAGLVTSLFAIYPDSTTDNFIHLQPLRHFWALSVENRCLVTRDVSSGDIRCLDVEVHLTSKQRYTCLNLRTPCILPEISEILHLKITGDHIWPLKVDAKDISPCRWEYRLNYITVFAKCIVRGWQNNKNITTNKRNFIRPLGNNDSSDGNTNIGIFLVPRKSKISRLNECNNQLNGHAIEYKHCRDANGGITSDILDIFEDLSSGAYNLSDSTTNVLEYCFSEDRLELVPPFLWILQKLNNIEKDLDVEFVCAMRIISELLGAYKSKVFDNAIYPLPVKKFLAAVETELELHIRKLDPKLTQFTQNYCAPAGNISSKHSTQTRTHSPSRAGYLTYQGWPYNLQPSEVHKAYLKGGELHVLEHVMQNYNMTTIPIHALRQLYNTIS